MVWQNALDHQLLLRNPFHFLCNAKSISYSFISISLYLEAKCRTNEKSHVPNKGCHLFNMILSGNINVQFHLQWGCAGDTLCRVSRKCCSKVWSNCVVEPWYIVSHPGDYVASLSHPSLLQPHHTPQLQQTFIKTTHTPSTVISAIHTYSIPWWCRPMLSKKGQEEVVFRFSGNNGKRSCYWI